MRVASGRHVATGDIDRNQALTSNQTGLHFERELVHRVALRLREATHLRGRELDIALDARIDVTCSPLDFFGS